MTRATDRLSTLLRRPRAADGEQGTALLLVLVAIMVAASLSIVLLGALIAQSKPIQLGRKNEKTISAAQAGFDALLSQIRAATGMVAGKNQGVATKLPCWTQAAPLDGQLTGVDGGLGYSAYLVYYNDDPRGKSATWLADPVNQITCTPAAGAEQAPSYAVLYSTGTGAAVGGMAATTGDRSLSTVYQFQTNNTNIPGGPIHEFTDYGSSSSNWQDCWDAGTLDEGTPETPISPPVPSGSRQVTVAPCVSGAPQQGWQYRDNYSIALAITTKTDTDGYCLTAPATKGAPVTLEVCDPTNANGLLARQKWGVDNADRINYKPASTRYCLSPQAKAKHAYGSPLVTDDCTQGQGGYQSWTAEPQVGAGHAGAGSGQLVNYAFFGQCFDITDWDLNKAFLILYPCKQETDGSAPGWNEVVVYDPVNQWLYTKNHTPYYCAVAPAAAGGNVLMDPCDPNAVEQKWLQGDTANYTTGYTYIAKRNGLCLDAGAKSPYPQWNTIVTKACSSALTQKWNAPPNLPIAGLDDTRETTAD